ncbi:hypothetical protein BD770DRAFT_136395 [Pilaira anomala]|nr:hypothetical protein BD770DRAFT_136395 [Pilaira anomala]
MNLSDLLSSTTTTIEKFNADTIDTFCFHWPDMDSYVLVRVLESTIAILPIQSRLAFLYFHGTPLSSSQPSPKELRKALLPVAPSSKRLHEMFKNWKHTLALVDEQQQQHVHLREPPPTPKSNIHVSLGDVVAYEPRLTGWLHAPCTVNDDLNLYDNHIILSTTHTSIRLTARCYSDKMAFMNLVKLKQKVPPLPNDSNSINDEEESESESESEEDEEEEEEEEEMSHHVILDRLLKRTRYDIERMQVLSSKVEIAKETISRYTQQLALLDKSLEVLEENTQVQLDGFEPVLEEVNFQLVESFITLDSYRERIDQLHERVSLHQVFLIDTRQKFEKIRNRVKNHAWYPWFYTCKFLKRYFHTYFLTLCVCVLCSHGWYGLGVFFSRVICFIQKDKIKRDLI